jgi:hypothetical protein
VVKSVQIDSFNVLLKGYTLSCCYAATIAASSFFIPVALVVLEQMSIEIICLSRARMFPVRLHALGDARSPSTHLLQADFRNYIAVLRCTHMRNAAVQAQL